MSFLFRAPIATANPRVSIRIAIGVVALVILGMWAAVGASIVTTRRAAIEDARIEARNLMVAFRDETNQTLHGVDAAMAVLAERVRREGPDFDLFTWSQRNILVAPGVANASFIDPQGRLRSTTLAAKPDGSDYRTRAHVRVHLDRLFAGMFIGPTMIGRISGAVALPISRRVEAPDGSFLGVLVVLIKPSALTRLHKSIDLGPQGILALTGLDNLIRVRYSADSPDGTKGVGVSIADTLGWADGDQIVGSRVRRSVVDGTERLYASSRVGDYPLIVSVGLDLKEKLTAASSEAKVVVALALVASVLLSGLVAYLVRELRARAVHEVQLAQERNKLRRANAALAESTAHAEAASRAKTMFLANMSHELRTPLNAIIGFSQLIRDRAHGLDGGSLHREYAGHVVEAGEHLLKLIIEILDTAKIEAGKLVMRQDTVDIREIVDRSVAHLQLALDRRRLGLRRQIAEDLPLVRGDADRLTQVLINLLSNAVKFTPDGGQITVAAECNEGGALVCAVSDTGIGMSAGEIAIALEPFSQLENSLTKNHEGTGLGLPLAKRLVELHGGTFKIDSEKGVGTTVALSLPAERLTALSHSAVRGHDRGQPSRPIGDLTPSMA